MTDPKNAGLVACGVACDATSPEVVLTQQGLNAKGASTLDFAPLPHSVILRILRAFSGVSLSSESTTAEEKFIDLLSQQSCSGNSALNDSPGRRRCTASCPGPTPQVLKAETGRRARSLRSK